MRALAFAVGAARFARRGLVRARAAGGAGGRRGRGRVAARGARRAAGGARGGPKCRLRTARTGPRRAHHWPSRQHRCVASLLLLVRIALIGFSRCERVMQVTRRSKRDAIHSMQWPTHEALLTRRSRASDVGRTPTSCLPVVSVHLNQRTPEGACWIAPFEVGLDMHSCCVHGLPKIRQLPGSRRYLGLSQQQPF